MQLQLWDAPAAIENPGQGLKVGQTWKSLLFVPSSMVIRKGLDVTYTLEEIQGSESGGTVIIKSSYQASDQKPKVPLPYEGSFQLAGSFGFFRSMFKGFSVQNAEGSGEQIYDIDSGNLTSLQQNYTVVLKPNAAPMPGTDPVITIEQQTSIQLLED